MTRLFTTFSLAASFAALSLCSHTSAATITTGDVFPDTAEIITVDPSDTGFGDDGVEIAQTFQVSDSFFLEAFAFEYEYDTNSSAPDPSEIAVDFAFYEVVDTNAATLTLGTQLLLLTDLVFPPNPSGDGSDEEALVALNAPLSLPATTGTAGYALVMTGGTTDGSGSIGSRGLEWTRTTGDGLTYLLGDGYEDGAIEDRDYVLALIAVPEPTTLASLMFALSLSAVRRRP